MLILVVQGDCSSIIKRYENVSEYATISFDYIYKTSSGPLDVKLYASVLDEDGNTVIGEEEIFFSGGSGHLIPRIHQVLISRMNLKLEVKPLMVEYYRLDFG